MRSFLRPLLAVAAIFVVLLACDLVNCPTCTDLERDRVRECEAQYGPGAIVIGFQCGYVSAEDPCGVVANRGQCNFNGVPQSGIRETVTSSF